MSNVIAFRGATIGDIPVAKILDGAKAKDLTAVIVIGETADGEPYYASSTGSAPEMNWMADLFKKELLDSR